MTDTGKKQVVHRSRFVQFTPGNITALAFSHKSTDKAAPQELRLAIGRSNGNIEIWNPRDDWVQEFVILGGEGRSIEGLSWCSIRGEPLRLFSIGGSTVVTEWDLTTGLPLVNYDCNSGVIWSIAMSNDMNKLAVGCDNGSVVLINISGGKGVLEHESILTRQESRVLSLTWTANDESLVAGCSDGRIRIWYTKEQDENKGRLLHTMKVDKSKKESTLVWSVLYLAKQNQIVSGDSTGSVKFWDLNYATLTQSFKVHDADVLCLATDLDNSQLFTSGVDRKIFQFSYIDTGKSMKWISTSNRLFHSNDVRSMSSYQCMGSDFLVSGGIEKSLVMCSMSSFAEGNYRKMPLVTPFHKSILVNKQQRLLVMWQDNIVKIWYIGEDVNEPKNYKLVSKLVLKDEQNIQTCALSTDGQVLLVGRLNTTKVFHLQPTDNKLKVTKLDNEFLLRTGCKFAKFIDDSRLIMCSQSDEIVRIDLEEDDDEKTVTIELPEANSTKSSNKLSYLNAVNHLDANERYAVASRGTGALDLIDLTTNSSKALIRMNNFITALCITPRETVVVVTSENKIYEFNLESEKDQLLTDWFKANHENLPRQFTSLKERCTGIFLDEMDEHKVWFWGSNWLVNINMSLDLPVSKRKKQKKRDRDGLTISTDGLQADVDEDDEDDEELEVKEDYLLKTQRAQDVTSKKRSDKAFFYTDKYRPLLFAGKIASDQLIIVERPNFLISQPPAFELEKLVF
ncbi:small subunit rRNA maturation protein UTP4 [Kluyveromyces lactis]|uniref:KLLA0D13222p n=1 Tax=Kluyveromyces lactis (strain ATCC 8585 / CBS 2359 / DSM 70799 / NBRC 1267 / NRRL Y-1140 / WM37) TaxID=284590 RepID=Q6CQY7_KLULA|nr:uncharacterized protein KLLA0_D13222g [Kluyveromyces lactis]CAH00748.1 KLLA0D13222p [Kluyveromyces lactis]|eukprot:XP_453652.1 uncharacterized protein KLLA0_D13222g [Kluyveromyces lactis]